MLLVFGVLWWWRCRRSRRTQDTQQRTPQDACVSLPQDRDMMGKSELAAGGERHEMDGQESVPMMSSDSVMYELPDEGKPVEIGDC